MFQECWQDTASCEHFYLFYQIVLSLDRYPAKTVVISSYYLYIVQCVCISKKRQLLIGCAAARLSITSIPWAALIWQQKWSRFHPNSSCVSRGLTAYGDIIHTFIYVSYHSELAQTFCHINMIHLLQSYVPIRRDKSTVYMYCSRSYGAFQSSNSNWVTRQDKHQVGKDNSPTRVEFMTTGCVIFDQSMRCMHFYGNQFGIFLVKSPPSKLCLCFKRFGRLWWYYTHI